MEKEGKLLQDRYRIDRQIGQGGMGAVYIAVDERFGSTVAIKQTLCMDDNYRKAIEREARLLNSLKHVALPRVSDHFLEDNGQYLVMEYVPGEDLFCILEEQGKPFPSDQVLEWADQLLDALDFLHNQSNPVIHRDIKPQNLKVMHSGQIVLLDFGLAKGNPTDAPNNTAAKSIFGYSRNYASLEQIQGTGTDPRSDLYSLAATLYHLVTGVPPEDALTRAMAVLSHDPDPLKPAHLVNPDVPAGFSAILHSTLDLNAGGRPSTAAELRSMLRDHENYAGSAATFVEGKAVSPAIHDQKTRLFHEKTAIIEPASTGVKTDVLPTGQSQVTVQRVPALAGVGGKEPASSGVRRLTRIAGALAALLLIGAGVGAMLLYSEPLTSGESEIKQDMVPAPLTAVEPEMPLAPTENAAANSSTQNSVENSPSAVATAQTAQVNETKKTSVGSTSPPIPPKVPRTVIEDGGETIIIEGDTIYVGNKKITADRIVPPNANLADRGRRPLPPGVRLPPEELRHLTPEQQRLLREAIRKAANANMRITETNRP